MILNIDQNGLRSYVWDCELVGERCWMVFQTIIISEKRRYYFETV